MARQHQDLLLIKLYRPQSWKITPHRSYHTSDSTLYYNHLYKPIFTYFAVVRGSQIQVPLALNYPFFEYINRGRRD